MLGGVKSKAEPATLNMLGTLMGENTKHVRKATGKATNETVDNRGRLLRFVENIVEKACALVCPNDASGMLELYHEDKQAAAFDDTSLMSTIADVAAALPERSNQRRALLACVAASQDKIKVQSHIKMGRKLWKTSVRNSDFLLHGHELQSAPMTQQRYKKAVVEDAVEHVLEHTQQGSWGSTDYHMTNLTTPVDSSKKVVLWDVGASKKINIPCLRRESGLNSTWRDYYTSRVSPDDRIGEKAFRDLQKALTAGQRKARTGVNYVEAVLLHDPLTKLGRVVDAACPEWPKKKMLACLKYFFKVE